MWGAALVGVVFSVLACGGEPDGAATSASASATPEPTPCVEVSAAEQLARCKEGDAVCCDVLERVTKPDAKDYLDVMATACGGGAEPACQKVRDADRDAEWKLAAFDRACTRIGRWPCRSALVLTLLLHFDRAPKAFENACRQTNDPEIQLAKRAFKCPNWGPSNMGTLKGELEKCMGGDLDTCRTIADVDGVSRRLMMEAVFRARGVDAKKGVEAWVQPIFADDLKPAGRVDIEVPSKDAGAKEALAKRQDALRLCVADRIAAKAKPKGTIELLLAIDKAGKVAYAVERSSGVDDAVLPSCLRRALQEAEALPAGDAGRTLGVKLTVAP